LSAYTTYNINEVNGSIPKLYQPHNACYLVKVGRDNSKITYPTEPLSSGREQARWHGVFYFRYGGPFASSERPTQVGPFVSGALVLQGLRES